MQQLVYTILYHFINFNPFTICLKIDNNPYSIKTSKLNSALQVSAIKKSLYIGVFDSDSMPGKDSFSWILSNISDILQENKILPIIFQQIPVRTRILNIKNSLVKIYEILHIKRSLGIEGLKLLNCNNTKIDYIMGASVYILTKYILNEGGFSGYNDDLRLGRILRKQKHRRIIIPYFNPVCSINNFKELKNQLNRICDGLFSKIDHYKLNIIQILWVYYDTLFFEFIFIITLLWAIFTVKIYFVVLIIFISYIFGVLYSILFNYISDNKNKISLFTILLLSLLSPFVDILKIIIILHFFFIKDRYSFYRKNSKNSEIL